MLSGVSTLYVMILYTIDKYVNPTKYHLNSHQLGWVFYKSSENQIMSGYFDTYLTNRQNSFGNKCVISMVSQKNTF